MKTLFDKIWDKHIVKELDEDSTVVYIDRHLIHEVTSPQAFDSLKERGIPVFRSHLTTATCDHNVPTKDQHLEITNEASRKQVKTLENNCKAFGIEYYGMGHENQGIVHVIGPELGLTQPGMTIVCGDSHTSTHGAFGALAFGIGTSQVAQVLASQCLIVSKPKRMRITVNGELGRYVSPKDVILFIISKLGTNGGTGYFVEYAGDVFDAMTMEGRMTVCNMSIEFGARGGMIAPDEITFDYLRDKKFASENFVQNKEKWESLKTDANAVFDKEYSFHADDIPVMITYGTNPGMGMKVNSFVPEIKNSSEEEALRYMGFSSGKQILDTPINYVFIGSCTNARIEDFRVAAGYVRGKQKAENVNAYLVPGSQKVRKEIFAEGLGTIFSDAGFEIRDPGCSACLAMNEDKVPNKEYCVSTSNRNFEGRQGKGSRTLLASPLYAAMVAVAGKIIEIG